MPIADSVVTVATLKEIVVDCRDAPTLARFWAEVLDEYDIAPYDATEIERLASLGLTPETDPTVGLLGPGPEIFFQQVPEQKLTKNRLHLDVVSAHRGAEVDRLLALGASVYAVYDGRTVLLDPEGNEFCVVDPAP